MHEKTIPNIIPNSERLNAFPLKLGTKQGYPTFTSAIRHKKEIIGKKIGKGKVKLFPFREDMIM